MNTISSLFFSLQGITLHLNLICLLVTFLGSLYVAIHSRAIPLWVRTPLWYLGVTSFIVALSIVFEWTLGPQFILSYSRFGPIGEMLINLNIAIASLLMFINTVYKDVCSIKYRRHRRFND